MTSANKKGSTHLVAAKRATDSPVVVGAVDTGDTVAASFSTWIYFIRKERRFKTCQMESGGYCLPPGSPVLKRLPAALTSPEARKKYFGQRTTG